jgi:hypothetical protein
VSDSATVLVLVPRTVQVFPEAKESVKKILKALVLPPPPVRILPAGQVTEAMPFAPGATETEVPKTRPEEDTCEDLAAVVPVAALELEV